MSKVSLLEDIQATIKEQHEQITIQKAGINDMYRQKKNLAIQLKHSELLLVSMISKHETLMGVAQAMSQEITDVPVETKLAIAPEKLVTKDKQR